MNCCGTPLPTPPPAGTNPCGFVAGVEAWSIELPEPDIKDYVLGFAWPVGGKLSTLVLQSGLGSGHCTVKINNVGVTGLIGLILDTTRREYRASGLNDVNVGDDVVFSIDDGDDELINVNATLSIQPTQAQ